MHSFICSSLPLSSLQIVINVSGHISTALIVADDTERDLMHLKLPLAHPHSTAYEKKEKMRERKRKNKKERKIKGKN